MVYAMRELEPRSSHIVGFCFVLFFVLVLILTQLYQDPMAFSTKMLKLTRTVFEELNLTD